MAQSLSPSPPTAHVIAPGQIQAAGYPRPQFHQVPLMMWLTLLASPPGSSSRWVHPLLLHLLKSSLGHTLPAAPGSARFLQASGHSCTHVSLSSGQWTQDENPYSFEYDGWAWYPDPCQKFKSCLYLQLVPLSGGFQQQLSYGGRLPTPTIWILPPPSGLLTPCHPQPKE